MINLTRKEASKSNNGFVLHISWIVFVAKRMLQHESSFIIKWTLLSVLNLNLADCLISHHTSFKLFIKILIGAINNQELFNRSEEKNEDSLLPLQDKIHVFLKNSIAAQSSTKEKVLLLKMLLEAIQEQSWSGVALVYLCHALSQLNDCQAWDEKDFIHVRSIISEAHHTQEPILRGAIQCYMLESCIKFLNWNSVTFHDLSELLSYFQHKECFVRHSTHWTSCVSKLKVVLTLNCKGITRNNAKSFCEECITKIISPQDMTHADDFCVLETSEMKKMSTTLMILADSGIICHDLCMCPLPSECLHWRTLLMPIVDILLSTPRRPYLHQQKFFNSLLFYLTLLELCHDSTDTHRISLVNCVGDFSEVVIFITKIFFTEILNIRDIEKFNILIKALHLLSRKEEFHHYFIGILPSFLNHCERIIYEKLMHLQLRKGLSWVCEFYYQPTLKHNEFVDSQLQKILHNVIDEIFFEISFSKPKTLTLSIDSEEWIKVAKESVGDLWNIACYILQNLKLEEKNIQFILQKAIHATNTNCQSTVISIGRCLQLLVPKLSHSDETIIHDTLEPFWIACLEVRRSEFFRPALKTFIATVFQKETMNEKFSNLLSDYIKKLIELSENSSPIFIFIMERLCFNFKLDDIRPLGFRCISLFAHALTFGPIHRKDQKVIEDVILFVKRQGEDIAANELLSDAYRPDRTVRAVAIEFLLRNLTLESQEDEEFVLELIEQGLLDIDKKASQCRSARFSNSYSHRLKNRVWQAILVLKTFVFTENGCRKLLAMTIDHLATENQQPSVRRFQEWTAIRILIFKPDLFEQFLTSIDSRQEQRLGYASSFLAVLVHVIKRDVLSESSLALCFDRTFEFCMSQNFTVRLHAQLALKSLWLSCKRKRLDDLLAKHDYVENLFIRSSSHGNFVKVFAKLSDDFYFSAFDPLEHYTLETIYRELPRLSNLTSDEWIDPGTFADSPLLARFNRDCGLATARAPVPQPEPTQDAGPALRFQKKITPWKESLLGEAPEQRPAGLIVVASLVDRLPNLGGLCRTCEVFGVQEYVIGSLQFAKDQHFQNLAVTADRWVPMREVRPTDLKTYLSGLRADGYALVAAEQTEDSRPLGHFPFPRKCAVLLGHEREGVPPQLLQMADACVQIPQRGVVRSLNVHVSGALLIWEYARQHPL